MSMDYYVTLPPSDEPASGGPPIRTIPGRRDGGPRRYPYPVYSTMPVQPGPYVPQPAQLDTPAPTGPPATGTTPPAAPGSTAAPPASGPNASGGGIGDALGGMLSGSIMGIPTIYIIGGVAAYFLFFKKH